MTWNSTTVPTDRLAALLMTIRGTGGTVTNLQAAGRRRARHVDHADPPRRVQGQRKGSPC